VARQPAAWNRTDSLVVLASFLERPGGMTIPPQLERMRVANVLGHDVAEVVRRYWMFVALEQGQDDAGTREKRLWARFADAPLECAIAAEEALAERRPRPDRLYR